ncbi:MAG: chromosomal replication initiator protein DnaA [Verrucomicrobia bacterium]|nr:MAG: chromosomal replication initiator protein DnaA [Verrucomicrobiota bacterium]
MSSTTTEQPVWPLVKAELARQLPKDIFEMWFKPIRCIQEEENNLVLSAPNDFAAIWIHDNYLDLIAQRARLEKGHPIEVSIERQDRESADRIEHDRSSRTEQSSWSRSGTERAEAEENRKSISGSLNPRNTFENFVVGSNNQLAHAATMAVAQAPAHAYNPLFIYAATGLGKTHLMHAVGHSILKTNPKAKIAYLSSEKFTNEFINAIQENTLTRFRKRYRSVDVLLLDDVQFLSGKERIQEEFFHTFNDLFESQKQIFLSSDRPANEIARLESRLVSRFQWGLMADIQSPDFETRVAILRAKAKTHRFEIDPEIIDFVAQHIVRNIRRLEGALIKVASYSSLTGRKLDLKTVEELLRDVLMEEAQRLITIDGIQKRVADYYQLRTSDMVSKRRPANIAFPRQIAMYLSRILTKHSLQEIGENFGGRDHGTVIHACRSVENMMEQDQSVRNSVEFLKTQLSK